MRTKVQREVGGKEAGGNSGSPSTQDGRILEGAYAVCRSCRTRRPIHTLRKIVGVVQYLCLDMHWCAKEKK